MNESLNICLPCGICCDGTLIGVVQLEFDELPALREIKTIEESNGEGFFLEPCENLKGVCNIYTQRPKQCAKFKCALLKSVEQKKIEFDLAIEVINEVKQKKIAIEKQLATLHLELPSQSFYFKILEFKKLMLNNKSESVLPQNHQQLIADIDQLDQLVTTYFGVSLS